jgi:hypothetical protein
MSRLPAFLALMIGLLLALVVALPAAGCKSDSAVGDTMEQMGDEAADVADDVGDKAEDLADEAKPVGQRIGEKAEQLGNEAVEMGREIGRRGDELIDETRAAIGGTGKGTESPAAEEAAAAD